MEKEGKNIVDTKQVDDFVRKNNITFLSECSAKNNTNIVNTFKMFYTGT